ncbi:MAG: prepilin-type N-terminal cleavage/methylation domain-containing protein [Bdellovibrionales bacterium]
MRHVRMIPSQIAAFKSKAGFSLLEAMIGVAVFSVIIAGVTAMIHWVSLAQLNSKAVQTFNNLIGEAQMVVDTVAGCTANFGGMRVNGGNPAPVDATIHFFNPAVSPVTLTEPLAEPAQIVENAIRIDSVTLSRVSRTSANRVIARVTVRASKVGSPLGSNEMSQSFPIYALTDDSGEIVSCYGTFSNGGNTTAQQLTCELISGGQSFWDPVTNRCVARYYTKCFPGSDSSVASCDPRTTLGLVSCRPTRVRDTFSGSLHRTYENGRTISSIPPGAAFCQQVSTFSGQCVYATDAILEPGNVCEPCCKMDKLADESTTPPPDTNMER